MRVNIGYHIVFDTNHYSVPYNLVQELLEVRSTPTTIEPFIIASAWLHICVRVAMGTP